MISVIVIGKNEGERLVACLKSIQTALSALPMLENPNTFFIPKRFVFGFSFYVSTNRK